MRARWIRQTAAALLLPFFLTATGGPGGLQLGRALATPAATEEPAASPHWDAVVALHQDLDGLARLVREMQLTATAPGGLVGTRAGLEAYRRRIATHAPAAVRELQAVRTALNRADIPAAIRERQLAAEATLQSRVAAVQAALDSLIAARDLPAILPALDALEAALAAGAAGPPPIPPALPFGPPAQLPAVAHIPAHLPSGPTIPVPLSQGPPLPDEEGRTPADPAEAPAGDDDWLWEGGGWEEGDWEEGDWAGEDWEYWEGDSPEDWDLPELLPLAHPIPYLEAEARLDQVLTQVEPEIGAIAAWVYTQVETQWYAGHAKSPVFTLEERAGNDTDTAALLVTLLRRAGYASRYATGLVTLGPEQWPAITGLAGGADAARFLAAAGLAVQARTLPDGTVVGIQVPHTWVEVFDPGAGQWLALDPSWKPYDRKATADTLD